jgi:type I restriction enzyme, S subunit
MTSEDVAPICPEAFSVARLADLCDDTRGITYGIVKVGEFVSDGVPVVRGGDVRNGQIATDDDKRVTSQVSERFRRTILQGGEIVLNLIGEPGHSAIVPDRLAGANVTRDVAVIPVTRADARFVNYFLQSPRCIAWLRAHLQGSVTLKINLGTLASLPVPNPPIDEQWRIATILQAFDDKIDSNRRLTSLIGEIAAALFRARLVDFVGVEDFEASEIGPIPRGWTTGSLTSLARFINGKAFTKEANAEGRPILRIKELNAGIRDETLRTDVTAAEEYLARHHDILFAWSGSLAVYRWSGPESLINQHIFKVIPEGYPPWFVYQWVRRHMPEFQAIARDKATTMGHIQRRHLSEARVTLPDSDTLARMSDLLEPLDRWQGILASEIASLAATRDALLPKLISGETRVPDTTDSEEVIGPAAGQLAGAKT